MMKTILAILIFVSAASAGTKDITLNTAVDLGPFSLTIGTNGCPVGMNGLRDFTALYCELGFEAIRTHDYYGPCDWQEIFPAWSADADDPASYQFASSDLRVQRIVEGGFDVLFRLGSSWRGNRPQFTNDPPGTIRDTDGTFIHRADSADFVKFASICKHIVMHYNDGWAGGFHYGIRSWEIWNEPSITDQFWTGNPQQFYQMFAAVAETLKQYDPDLLVGGPGLAGHYKNAYCNLLLSYCQSNHVPLDFFTWHSYGGERESITPWSYAQKARLFRRLLNTYGFESTLSICDEWNAGLGPVNFADTGRGAAYYAAVLTYLAENGVSASYQYRWDDHPLGLVRNNGGLKLAAESFRVWKMLAELGQRLESSGTDSSGFTVIASGSSSRDTVRILIANYPDETQQCHIHLRNLPGSAASNWKITRRQIREFHRLAVVDSFSTNSPDSFTFTIEPESVELIELRRQETGTGIKFTPWPQKFGLLQSYPNPFNSPTTIEYHLSRSAHVILRIYNIMARVMKTLVDENQSPGKYAVLWDGRDDFGKTLPAGIYFYRLSATSGQIKKTGKLLLLR